MGGAALAAPRECGHLERVRALRRSLSGGRQLFYVRPRVGCVNVAAGIAAPARFLAPVAGTSLPIDERPLIWAEQPDLIRLAHEACERARTIVASCVADRQRWACLRAMGVEAQVGSGLGRFPPTLSLDEARAMRAELRGPKL